MASFSSSAASRAPRKFKSPPAYKPNAAKINSKKLEDDRAKRQAMMESLGISSDSEGDYQSTSSSSEAIRVSSRTPYEARAMTRHIPDALARS